MVGAFEEADVVAVEDDFAFEFVPVLLDVVSPSLPRGRCRRGRRRSRDIGLPRGRG